MDKAPVIKTVEDYQLHSARHDQKDNYQGVRDRLQADPELVVNTLTSMVELASMMDFVKKKIAYGADPESADFKAKFDKRDKEISELISDQDQYHLELFKDETFARLYHYYLGLFTESGELLEALLKALKSGKLDIVNLKEEHGDLDWYKSQASTTIGSTLIEEMALNDKKLHARYEKGFSNDKAMKRDTDKERKILEGK